MTRATTKLLGLGFLLSCFAWADDEAPGRGVARLSLMNGDVSIRRGDSGDLVAAAVNAPLVTADHVLTGAGSRAEVQFDWANMLRLSSDTEVKLADLENRRYQVQVARGTVTFRVLRDSNADVEVDTPSVSVRPVKRGVYRITVREDGESEVTVRSGEAEVFTPKGVERLHSGRTMMVRGPSSDPEYQIVSALAYDNWDRWNEDRDRRLERTRSYQYVSRDIYGADDLDYYGRWNNVPPYGWVWSPYGVDPYWAPYRYGRWSWTDWYGWTWVDYAPWGWAPYHYGRWFWHAPFGWCWFPGSIYSHYFWRPALVAFFGFHVGGVHVGFGFGHLGWVPLAPYEPFYPWYGRGWCGGHRNNVFIDNSVRIVNNTNITNIYRNARVSNGVTAIDSGDFVRGRAGRAWRTDAEIRSASLVQGAVPVVPARESLRVSDRAANPVNLPRNEPARFFTRRPAANIERVPFDDQRRGMEQVVRRTFGDQAGQPGPIVRTGQGEGVRGGPAATAGGIPRTGAERRGESGMLPGTAAERGAIPRTGAGDSVRTSAEQPPNAGALPRTGESGGWRRIGEDRRIDRSGESARQESPARIERTPDAGTRDAGRVERREDIRRESGDGWRRFGGQAPRTEPPPRQEAPARIERTPDAGSRDPGRIERRQDMRREFDSGGWRQFGAQPRVSEPPARVERAPESRRESDSGWQRFGTWRHDSEAPNVRTERSQPMPRSDWPRSEPRSESPRFERREMPRWESRGAEPLRINPPIVRERSEPRFERPGGFGGRAPEMSAPRMGGGEMRGVGGMSRIEGGSRGGELRGGGETRGGGMSRSEGGSRGGRGR